MNQEKAIQHLAMYLRISMEKKEEGVETLANHRQLLVNYCKENGYTYVEFGEVISGGKTELEDRVQLQNLLNRIEEFDAILVVELSRLSRNGLISQTVKQYCIDYDVPILTPYQTYDLANNENHRLMYDLGSLISSHEHGVIGKRSKTNKIQMAKQGLHISGGIPYGFFRNPKTKKLEINEEASKTIQYIFQLHSQGYGSFKIRDILNEEGYKSATGKVFNIPAIKRIIQNPHYKGDTVFHDRKRIKRGGKVTYETVNTIVMKGTHPAIISPEVWDKANSDRMERAEKSRITREKPVTKSEITMLKDLIYCGVCHKKLIIRKDNKSNTGYTIKRCEYLQANGDKCPNCGIRVEFVEEKVLSRLQEFKKQLQSYIKLIEENGSDQVKQDQQQKINQLQKRLKEVEFEENNLLDLAIKGLFSHDKIRDKQQELINLKTNIETQLESIQNEEVEQVTESTKDKINEILEIIDKLPTLNKEQVNQSLKTFIKKIHYKRVIPEDLLKLSTQNKQRKLYPFELQMEYYQL